MSTSSDFDAAQTGELLDATTKDVSNGIGGDVQDITNTIGQFDPIVGWYPTFSMGLGYSETGVRINPITALGVPVFNACVRRISSDIAGLPILVEQYDEEKGWKNLPRHPIARLLKKPNERHTRFELIEHLVVSYLLAGDGYSAIVFQRNPKLPNAGRPIQLIPIVPISCNCHETPNGRIVYNVTSKMLVGTVTSNRKQKEQTRELVSDEMVHIRNMSLDGGVHGTSPITIGAEAIGLAIAAQAHAAKEFKNGSSFRFAVVLPPSVKQTDPSVGNTQAAWQMTQAGLHNSGKPPVVAGGASLVKMNMSPEEAQLIEARDQQNAEIARLMNVPGSLVGLKDGTAFANYEVEMQSYIDKTLLPIIEKLQQIFDQKLLFESEQDDHQIRFDTTGLLRGDTASRYAAYQTACLNGWINADYVADKEGWARPPDGHVYTQMTNTGVAGSKDPLPVATPTKPTSETSED